MQYSSLKPSDVKSENKAAILRFMYKNEGSSKPEVSKVLGISKPTVSSLVDELVEEGYLRIEGVGTSTNLGGKRPTLFTFNASAGSAIAIYIGLGELQAALIDLKVNVKHRLKLNVDTGDITSALTAMSTLIRKMLQYSQNAGISVLGIGISSPGVIESRKGILAYAAHLEGWNQFPIASYMEDQFHLPVWIDNESRNLALAENWFGIGRELTAFITLQTKVGVGTGIILNGSIYRGIDNSGGEFGHTTVDINGPTCRCGNKGCWELYASEQSLLSRLTDELPLFPDSLLSRKITEGEEVTFDLVAHCYGQQDEFVQKQISEYASYLSVGLVNLVNTFNPEAIILHGDLAALGTSFLNEVQSIVKKRALSLAAKRVVIAYSKIVKDSTVIGAATLVIKEAIDNKLIYDYTGYH